VAETMLDRAVITKQMLEQALRRSAQRAIQVTTMCREGTVVEPNGISALSLRVDAVAKKPSPGA